MHLTGEWFENLIKSVNACGDTGDERRRVPRIGVRFTAQMHLFEGRRALPAVQVRVRDISPLGFGFIHDKRLQGGQKLLLLLPQVQMEPLRILCEVRNCQVLTETLFSIGAQFVQIGDKGAAKRQADDAAARATAATTGAARQGLSEVDAMVSQIRRAMFE